MKDRAFPGLPTQWSWSVADKYRRKPQAKKLLLYPKQGICAIVKENLSVGDAEF
jgi:hypothetical protein